jgi:hypothetical protein
VLVVSFFRCNICFTDLCVPPPVPCPCLIKNTDLPLDVIIYSFRGIRHEALKGGISHQLSYAFNGISSPEFNLLRWHQGAIFANAVTSYLNGLVDPLWTLRWKRVNPFQKVLVVTERWLSTIPCLDQVTLANRNVQK